MTSLSSASIQKPSARTLSSGVPGPHGRVKSQTLQHPPRSVPHQILIDLTGAASSSRDSAEPLIKRQKVNGGQAYTTTCLGTRAPEDVDRNAGQVWRSALTKDAAAEPNGGAINIPATSGFTAGHDTNNAIPPFPARPLKHVRANRNQSNGPRAPGKPTSRGDVLVKPYQLEVPAIAPHYQGAGTYLQSATLVPPEVQFLTVSFPKHPRTSFHGQGTIQKTRLTNTLPRQAITIRFRSPKTK